MLENQPDSAVWKKAVDMAPQALTLWSYIPPPLSFLDISNVAVEEHDLSED